MRTTDFAAIDAVRTIALLPVAAVEQHGPHLPLSTDAVINEGIVRLMMQRLPADSSVLVLPALTVGDSLEHTTFKGTLSVDPDRALAARTHLLGEALGLPSHPTCNRQQPAVALLHALLALVAATARGAPDLDQAALGDPRLAVGAHSPVW